MALVSVKEDGFQARSNRTSSEATVTRFFIATYDTPTNGWLAEDDVLSWIETNENSSGILPGDESATYPRRLKQLQTKIRDSESPRMHWEVQVDYSDTITIDQNPLQLPDEISWDFGETNEAYFIDENSTPKLVTTIAGELFQNLPTRETGTISATVKRNVSSYDPAQAITYLHACNSDSFTIDGKVVNINQAKMSSISCGGWQFAKVNGVQIAYRQETFHLKFKEDWDDHIDDRGFNEKDTANAGKLKPILKGTPAGTKVDKPWPLNGSGAAKTNSTDTPYSLDFRPYKQLAYSIFSFS